MIESFIVGDEPRTTPVNRKRYGRLHVRPELLFSEQFRDALIWIGFIPVRVWHDAENDLFILDGHSAKFRECADAEAIVPYILRIHQHAECGQVLHAGVAEV